jgi:hypothetical protein
MVVLGLVLFFIFLYPLRINHDVAIYLEIGDFILEGKVPYVDYIEVNLPLIHYVNVIPVLLSRILFTNPIKIFLPLVYLLTILCIASIHQSLRILPPGEHLATWAITFGIAIFTLITFTLNDFGQREHIFLLLYFPYFFMRWNRLQGSEVNARVAILGGVSAGIGLLLKPHFVIILAATELYWLVSKRDLKILRNPEVISLFVVGVLYLFHFLIIPTSMRTALFGELLPSMLSGYSAYGYHRIPNLLGCISPIILITAVFFLLRRWDRKYWELINPLLVYTIAAIVVYIVQRKGWIYHAYPASFGGIILLSLLGVRRYQSRVQEDQDVSEGVSFLPKWSNRDQRVGLALIIVVFLAAFIFGKSNEQYLGYAQVREIIEDNSHEKDNVVFISTSVLPASQLLLQTERKHGYRYIVAHPVAFAFEEYSSAEEVIGDSPLIPEEVSLYLDRLEEDILKNQPPLIFVHTMKPCFACPSEFSMDLYLEAVGFFESEPMMAYEFLGEIEEWLVYRLSEDVGELNLESRWLSIVDIGYGRNTKG